FGLPAGAVNILDAVNDTLGSSTSSNGFSSTAQISVGLSVPTFLVVTPDRTKTLVVESTTHVIDVIDNKTEAVSATLFLNDNVTALVLLPDNKTGFAGQRATGAVSQIDLSANTVSTAPISVPTVHNLV